MRNFFAPIAHQNRIQRAGSLLFFFIFVVLVFLHNPIDGYTVSYRLDYNTRPLFGLYVTPDPQDADCYQRFQTLNDEKISREFRDIVVDKMEKAGCWDERLLPLTEWSSNAPFIEWLGSVIHFIWAVFVLCFLYAAWLFAFRSGATDD